MSTNLELVRRAYDVWNRDELGPWLEVLHPDLEWHTSGVFPDLDPVYRGELTVIGSRSASPSSFRAAVELLPSLRLPQVTALPLERFVEGVELYRRGGALKIVFTP